MTKLLVCLVLTALIAAAVGQGDDNAGDNNADRPLFYDRIKNKGLGRLLSFGCNLKLALQDRDVSDHVYKLFDTAKTIFDDGKKCFQDKLVAAVSNKDRAVGKAFGVLRLGQTGDVKDFNDIRDTIRGLFGNLKFLMLLPSLGQLDIGGLINDVRSLRNEIMDECAGKKLEDVKADLKVIKDKVKEFMKKEDEGTPVPIQERFFFE